MPNRPHRALAERIAADIFSTVSSKPNHVYLFCEQACANLIEKILDAERKPKRTKGKR